MERGAQAFPRAALRCSVEPVARPGSATGRTLPPTVYGGVTGGTGGVGTVSAI